MKLMDTSEELNNRNYRATANFVDTHIFVSKRVILSAMRSSRNKNSYRKPYRDYTESHGRVTKFVMHISCVNRAL